jgi:excisionase family DNA binding protein
LRLLTTKQLADYLAVHEKTIARWRRLTDPLPCVHVRSRVRFSLADVLAWVARTERRAE